MNVLFYTYEAVQNNHGGTERITISVAKGLKLHHGVHCFSGYSISCPDKNLSMFEDFIYFDLKKKDNQDVYNLLIKNKIDCILVQGYFKAIPYFYNLIKGTKIKLFFGHHYAPLGEMNTITFKECLKKFLREKKAKNLINCLIFPYLKWKKRKKIACFYKLSHDYSNKIILLSERYKKSFSQYGCFNDLSKFKVIPNMLSFEKFASNKDIEKKEKRVLIVTRLEDAQKRIILALKIWNNITSTHLFDDWSLDLVGHGEDFQLCVDYVRKHSIKNVYFWGKQDPMPFYENASIFMMTSKSEAWGLTLTESQQMGVVPFAFDTYESLHDIIDNEMNGFIIPEKDIPCYVRKMEMIMKNSELRKKMANNAVKKSKRFSEKEISSEWFNFFGSEISTRI